MRSFSSACRTPKNRDTVSTRARYSSGTTTSRRVSSRLASSADDCGRSGSMCRGMIWDEYNAGASREASEVPLLQFSGPAAHGRSGELEKK